MTLLLLFSSASIVENPVRGFKRADRPIFYTPIEKELTVKFKIPIYWINKLNIKLNLQTYYKIVYEKRLVTCHNIDENITIPTSIIHGMNTKLITFVESINNIMLKPDSRLEKLKRLARLSNILRQSSLNE